MYKEKPPWWETKIIKVEPNKIIIRGYHIEDLIGNISYAEMLYLIVLGELPHPEQARLLEAVLVAGCDHGPKAPSVAAARMASSCGISFNSCIATGINVLGDVHGGAGEQAMELFYDIKKEAGNTKDELKIVAQKRCHEMRNKKLPVPGFGHRFHNLDPRSQRLLELANEAQNKNIISGDYIYIAEVIRDELSKILNKKLTINIDGVSAAIQCEIGLPAKIAKGIFSLSRGMGLIAHAYEELTSGSKIKGPVPPDDHDSCLYIGVEERKFKKKR